MSELNVKEIVEKVDKIQGWLFVEEIESLALTVERCSLVFEKDLTIVEVGSYHGRSTVAMGLALKVVRPRSVIFAIDPHEGRLKKGDNKNPIESTYVKFCDNLIENDINNVQTYLGKSHECKWNREIQLLFIDGLHDYASVSRDFHHFEQHVEPLGFVAFHDYGTYGGVTTFVDEVLTSTKYEKVSHVKSLIVLQKQG
jgi:predicted O-methyltransferase YrrM